MSETKKDEVNNAADHANLDLIRNLSEIRGTSGHEDAIREYIKKIIKPLCDEVKTDSMGNLFGVKYGIVKDKCILLDAHMDEIGFLVRYIDKNGFLRLAPVGGQNIRLLPGLRVIISGEKGEIPGVFGEKAIHILEVKDRTKVNPMKKTFIDIGMSKEEAEKFVSIGDYAEFEQKLQKFHNSTLINGKSLDDRAGCYVLIRTLQEISKKNEKLSQSIVFGFMTQEEIGLRGATIGAYHINPTTAIALEVTHGIDYPSVDKAELCDIDLGKGPAIAVGPNLHPKISKKLINIAKKNNIPFQINPQNKPTGTDAKMIQVSRGGIPVGLISIPLRYMHTAIETIDLNDLENAVKLITIYIQKKLEKNYNL